MKYKFGVAGTSCCGKSTLVYGLAHKLKLLGLRVMILSQEDRNLPYDVLTNLEKDLNAQFYMVFSHVAREAELIVREDLDVLITDRTPLDLYAYLETTFGPCSYVKDFVQNYVQTYKKIFVLQPLEHYEDDKRRPSLDFRNRVWEVFSQIIANLDFKDTIVVVPQLPPNDLLEVVLSEIMSVVGHVLSKDELALIPEILGVPKVLIGGSYAFNRQTRRSDVDVYVLGDTCRPRKDLEESLKRVFGVPFDVTEVTQPVYDYLLKQGFKEVLHEQA